MLAVRSKPEVPQFLKQVAALADTSTQEIVISALEMWYGRDSENDRQLQERCLSAVKKHRLTLPFERPLTPRNCDALAA